MAELKLSLLDPVSGNFSKCDKKNNGADHTDIESIHKKIDRIVMADEEVVAEQQHHRHCDPHSEYEEPPEDRILDAYCGKHVINGVRAVVVARKDYKDRKERNCQRSGEKDPVNQFLASVHHLSRIDITEQECRERYQHYRRYDQSFAQSFVFHIILPYSTGDTNLCNYTQIHMSFPHCIVNFR